jgi:PilZ domain
VSIEDAGSQTRHDAATAAAMHERRAHRRKPTLWEGRLDTDAGVFFCVVLNISQGGAMVQATAPLTPTQRATLMIERFGSLKAHIVWHLPHLSKMGLRFLDPPQQVARILGGALPA